MSESNPKDFGRVEADGTVYVTTADGERRVGQVPDVSTDEAMDFFVRRYRSLETEVDLLVSRVTSGAASADEARKSVDSLTESIKQANAVGDLAALTAKLEALAPTIDKAAEERKAARAAARDEARAAKEGMVAQAEALSKGNDWRGGVNKFRQLLEDWKKLPRIDKTTDDELWHRFSAARTAYTRRRKEHFATQDAQRSGAQQAKEQIIEEARPLATSTDWGPTSGAFRDLMARWKAAGSAPRNVEDKLWSTFRGLQDQFFNARTASQAEQDAEFVGNLQAKQELLDQAEADILPVTDLASAKEKFRTFLAAFNELGKVPRDQIRAVDDRVRALEKAVKQAEDAEWKRTDPQARERAQDTVTMFRTQIDKLTKQAEQAEAKGKAKDAQKARDSIRATQAWLDQAEATLAEFKA